MTADSNVPSSGATDSEFTRVREYLLDLQDRICADIEGADGSAKFQQDIWQRPEGGGGRTRILRDGAVFEQCGIGFSDVAGTKLPPSATAARPELNGASWNACGVSLVFHPRNPYVPTTHANVRFFRAIRDAAVDVGVFRDGKIEAAGRRAACRDQERRQAAGHSDGMRRHSVRLRGRR